MLDDNVIMENAPWQFCSNKGMEFLQKSVSESTPQLICQLQVDLLLQVDPHVAQVVNQLKAKII